MAKTFKFYGVCGNRYKLDNTVWEAIEDESDGYRSYLDSIKISEQKNTDIFFENSLGTVIVQNVEDENSFTGFKLVEQKTGHVWLKIGTDYSVDYYPSFHFEYIPKDPNKFNADGSMKTWEAFINE